jgi:NAD(P)-dependent dehydrogenase (short-subunit alcohol dehydrogenase family)
MLLEGKVALITGGASGLGLETARLFAAEGAHILITDVSDEAGEAAMEDLRATGAEAQYVHADVTRSGEVDAAVEVAERTFGRLDIAVDNAGILGRSSFVPVEEVPTRTGRPCST